MSLSQTFLAAAQRHKTALDALIADQLAAIDRGHHLIDASIGNGRTVFACGNGGSMADSLHFIAELVGHYKLPRIALRGVALGANISTLTAVGNDDGYKEVFARELSALGREGDVLVAITTSGGSKNVLAAIEVAKHLGMKVIVLTGANGAHLADSADVCIAVPSGETARIQEMHQIIYHAWCEQLDADIDYHKD